MSNWATEANNEGISHPTTMDWKVKVNIIENNLRKLKQEADNMSQKFTWVKQNNGSYETFQNWIQKLTESYSEITKNMNDLQKLVPLDNELERAAKQNQFKQLSRRVESQMKHAQNLSSNIQKDMEKHYIEKKMAASILSQSSGHGDIRTSDVSLGNLELQTIEDSQLKEAIEEQQQCEKLVKNVIQLEEMMIKMSEMIHEQGETVDNLESQVIAAHQNVEEGEKTLSNAVDIKRKITKKQIYCAIGIVIALCLLALIIGLSVGLK